MKPSPSLTDKEQSLLDLVPVLVATCICQSGAHFELNVPLANALSRTGLLTDSDPGVVWCNSGLL